MYYEPTRVVLSTYFLASAETDPATASEEVGAAMPLANLKNATRDTVLRSIANPENPVDEWAACSDKMAENGAILPCRTGDTPERCIDGFDRHCGTVESNTREPWLEIDMVDVLERLSEDAPLRDYYYWGMELTFAREEAFQKLFWESAQTSDDASRAYTVTVYDEHHNPLPTQCKPFYEQVVDHWTPGLAHFQYVCLGASAALETYAAMRAVRYVRITLRGSYRMVWLDRIRVVWRALDAPLPAASPSPPAPPPGPPAAPDPPAAPAAHTCTRYPRLRLDASALAGGLLRLHAEPCGLVFAQCCALAYEHARAHVFELSASGCCTLFDVPNATDRAQMALGAPATLTSGLGDLAATGVRDEDLNRA